MKALPIGGLLLSAALNTSCYFGEAPQGCEDELHALQELLVVEDETLAHLEKNDSSSARFEQALLRLMPADVEPAHATEAWFAAWANSLTQHPVASDALNAVLVCPWLRATASNECSADCSTCTHREFNLRRAPLQLTAVVYRPDLQGHPDLEGAAGEARLVYAPRNLKDRERLSVIIEFPLPATQEKDWARRWHNLQGLEGTVRQQHLLSLVDDFARFEARCRVRTLLQAATNLVPMHEFSWNPLERRLLPVPLRRVPREDSDLQALAEFVNAHPSEVRRGQHVLPTSWRAPFANAGSAPPTLPGVDPELNTAFQRETCNGCHGHVAATRDHFFHIAPKRKNAAKLSPFLRAPDAHDELEVREIALRAQLCE